MATMETGESPRIDNFRRIPNTKLYRSSKPDSLASTLLLKKQNIRTIIDMCDFEAKKSSQCMDGIYHPFSLVIPFVGGSEKPNLMSLSEKQVQPEELLERDRRYRVTVPMCSIKSLVKSASWYIRLLVVLCSLLDKVFGTSLAMIITVRAVLYPLGADILKWMMQNILTEHGPELSSILHLLCRPEYMPAVIVCRLGKDRTGLVSALISHICGRDREDILTDYTQSEKELPSTKKEMIIIDQMGLHPATKKAAPEYLLSAFEFLEKRYGSIEEYLCSIGFSQEDQETLRRNILSKD